MPYGKVRLGYVGKRHPRDVMLTPCGIRANYTCKKPGILAEIWQSLGQRCHFHYEFSENLARYDMLVDFVKNGSLDASGELIYLADQRVNGTRFSSTVIDRPRVGFVSARAVSIVTSRVDIVCFALRTVLTLAAVLSLLVAFKHRFVLEKSNRTVLNATFAVFRELLLQVSPLSDRVPP